MLVLAIDTSTDACTAAILTESGPAYEITIPVRTGHAGSLLPVIDTLFRLSPYSKEDIGLLAVGVGPGSFTGIRIGIATAKGLSFALNLPLAGINTLDAMAHGALPSSIPVMPVIDARKAEVFCRLYSPDGSPLAQPMNVKPADLSGMVDTETLFLGNGIPLYRELFSRTLGNKFVEGPPHLWYPRASVIARMALSDFSAGNLHPALPQYVRSSDAMILLEKKRLGKA